MRENRRVRNVVLCDREPCINQLDELDSIIAILFGAIGSLVFFSLPYLVAIIVI